MSALAPQRYGARRHGDARRRGDAGEVARSREPRSESEALRLFGDSSGEPALERGELVPERSEPTLDEVICGAWESLAGHRSVPCPVCDGEMAPIYGAHASPIGGLCRDCGTAVG